MGHPRSFLSGHAPRLAVLGAALAAIAGSAANATPGSTPDLTVLHAFSYQPDGEYPEGRLVQGPDGTLYGTTYEGAPMGSG